MPLRLHMVSLRSMPLRLSIGGFSKFLVLIGMGQPLNIKCQGTRTRGKRSDQYYPIAPLGVLLILHSSQYHIWSQQLKTGDDLRLQIRSMIKEDCGSGAIRVLVITETWREDKPSRESPHSWGPSTKSKRECRKQQHRGTGVVRKKAMILVVVTKLFQEGNLVTLSYSSYWSLGYQSFVHPEMH